MSTKYNNKERGDQVGYTMVIGPTRVGKTHLAEFLISQDIRRGDNARVFNPNPGRDAGVLADCSKIKHYPVLITEKGISK